MPKSFHPFIFYPLEENMNFFTLISFTKIIGQSLAILKDPKAVVAIANAVAKCVIFIQTFANDSQPEEKKKAAIEVFNQFYDIQELVGFDFPSEVDDFIKGKMIPGLIELTVKLFNSIGIFATSKEKK